MSALSDLLNWHIEDKFPDKSNRQIAISAGVSRGTIDNYRSGSHPDAPGEEVLQAFHDLLGIPLAELRAAAGVPRGEPEPYKAPAEFNRLSHTQRTALDEFVRSFVGPQGASHADQPDTPVDSSSSSGAPVQAGREGQEGKPDGRFYVITMKTGPWAGRDLIISKAELDNKPAGVEVEVLQELPLGTEVDTQDGAEPPAMVIQIRDAEGKKLGPPRAVTRAQLEEVPYGTKVDIIWSPLPDETQSRFSGWRDGVDPGEVEGGNQDAQ